MESRNSAVVGCVLFVLLLNITVGGLCTEYVLEYWLTYFKGTVIDLPFWVCALIGLFGGEILIPAAIITFLLSLVL